METEIKKKILKENLKQNQNENKNQNQNQEQKVSKTTTKLMVAKLTQMNYTIQQNYKLIKALI